MCRLIQATAPISTSSPTAMPKILTPMVNRIAPRTLMRALLFRLQGPGAVPVGAGRLRAETGDARDEVDRIADHRVAARLLRANAADHDFAGGDADPDRDLGKPAPHSHQIRQFGLKRRQCRELFERRQAGEPRLLLGAGEGRTPE